MSILIGADIVPTKSNFPLFENGDVVSLLGCELLQILQSVDYRIFNLEVPLADQQTPIDKGGHNMIASTNSVCALKNMEIDLLTLSNNHILDQGEEGLKSTIACLNACGIQHVGAGSCIKEAQKPFYFIVNERKIGVYACAEHEYSIANEKRAGANPFDPLESLDHVAYMKQQCDYVIVLYHGGKEHYRYPSPNLQHVCRKLVEKGADLVLCQHSHCIGCEEKYKNSTILYGQGNFIFDLGKSEYWDTSLLVLITDEFDIKYIPIVRCGGQVRLADETQSVAIMKKFHERSIDIEKPDYIENEYKKFSKKATGYYFLELKGSKIKMFIFRVLNRLSHQKLMENYSFKRKYKGRHWKATRNYIECEAHRELILSALKDD